MTTVHNTGTIQRVGEGYLNIDEGRTFAPFVDHEKSMQVYHDGVCRFFAGSHTMGKVHVHGGTAATCGLPYVTFQLCVSQ